MPVSVDEKEIYLCSARLIGLMRAVHEKGGFFRFQAKGCSMSPFIRDGDVLTIAPLNGPVQTGDIVPFVRPCFNKLVVHRAVKKEKDGYLIKGDNARHPDGFVPQGNLLGKVLKIERGKREIRFGLGIEKISIAWLSRVGLLNILLGMIRWVLFPFRSKKGNG